MKRIFLATTLLTSTIAMSAPHWTHEEEAEWGGIQDSTQTVAPLTYPYAECNIGQHQSPVDLGTMTSETSLNSLQTKYVADKPDFFNSGHAVQVNVSSNYKGQLKIGSDAYPLIQYHFHAPSEHVIGSKTYPAELHFVHIRPDGKMAVLGVLLEEGKANSTIQTILDNVSKVGSEHKKDTGLTINPTSLLPKTLSKFYTYAGSLTTPPCSEGVNWYVLATPITVSTTQLTQLEDLYNDNARKAQNLNGRVVSGKK